jgi:hypothetical protein
VAAISVALGFLTARFIKSSAEGLRQDHSMARRGGQSQQRGTQGPGGQDQRRQGAQTRAGV